MKKVFEPTPRVTVITIYLNAEAFLGEAIQSVISQQFEDWEYLLVDDGSTDGSTAIGRQWAAKFPHKIRYLEHPGHANRGMGASRNKGIQEARGEFIAFLDSDDVWLPNKLQEQVAILQSRSDVALVYGPAQIWWSWNHAHQQKDHTIDLGFPPDTLIEPPALVLMLLENKAQTPMPSSILVRSDVVRDLGGFEAAFRGLFEDVAFLFKLGLRFPVFVSGKCWVRYRQHAASCCATTEARGRAPQIRRKLLRWVEKYTRETGCRDPQIRKALRSERLSYEYPRLASIRTRFNKIMRRFQAKLRTVS